MKGREGEGEKAREEEGVGRTSMERVKRALKESKCNRWPAEYA